jgi:hypothetical protein
MMLLMTRPVSQFPAESWLVNHGIQTMPMHPHMPKSLTPPSMSAVDNGDSHTLHTDRISKWHLQRQYRAAEVEVFSQLRQVIQEIAKESPTTRKDVLMKGL